MSWRLVILAMMLAASARGAYAGTLIVEPAPGLALPDIEVLAWAGPQDSAPVRIGHGGEASLAGGDYGLRIIGTDYRYGPVRLAESGRHIVRLAAFGVAAPLDSAPVNVFLLDAATGAAAARLVINGPAAAVWPGEYELGRDLATLRLPIRLSNGDSRRMTFGAVALAAPIAVEDFAYYLVDPENRIAAYARFAQGGQPVPAGTYRMIREESGISYELDVMAGETTTVVAAALKVSAIGRGNPPYFVVSADARRPVLRASAGELAHLLLPSPEPYAVVSPAGPNAESRAGTGFTPLAGRVANFWMRQDGTFLPAHPDGELEVSFAARRSGYVAAGETLAITVTVPEPASLMVRGLIGEDLDRHGPESSVDSAEPPSMTVDLVVPNEANEGGLFQIEAEARLSSGIVLKGRSGVHLVAPPLTSSVSALSVREVTGTTISLTWEGSNDPRVFGYNVYRVPHGTLPINGEGAVQSNNFVDIGLSSAKSYGYDVCAVDELGIEGPCSSLLSVETLAAR
jgi:hypothetical protein